MNGCAGWLAGRRAICYPNSRISPSVLLSLSRPAARTASANACADSSPNDRRTGLSSNRLAARPCSAIPSIRSDGFANRSCPSEQRQLLVRHRQQHDADVVLAYRRQYFIGLRPLPHFQVLLRCQKSRDDLGEHASKSGNEHRDALHRTAPKRGRSNLGAHDPWDNEANGSFPVCAQDLGPDYCAWPRAVLLHPGSVLAPNARVDQTVHSRSTRGTRPARPFVGPSAQRATPEDRNGHCAYHHGAFMEHTRAGRCSSFGWPSMTGSRRRRTRGVQVSFMPAAGCAPRRGRSSSAPRIS